MSELSIVLERLVDAGAEEAFHAWTDSDARAKWYAPDDGWMVEAETDLRVGGSWRVAFGPTEEHRFIETGVFREVDPPRRVVYTQNFTTPDGTSFQTLVTVTFTERDGKTLLRMVDAGLPNEEWRSRHESGWPRFLDRFEKALAQTSTI